MHGTTLRILVNQHLMQFASPLADSQCSLGRCRRGAAPGSASSHWDWDGVGVSSVGGSTVEDRWTTAWRWDLEKPTLVGDAGISNGRG